MLNFRGKTYGRKHSKRKFEIFYDQIEIEIIE